MTATLLPDRRSTAARFAAAASVLALALTAALLPPRRRRPGAQGQRRARHGARAGAGPRPDHRAGRGDRRGRALQRARGPDQDQHRRQRSRRCSPRAGRSTPTARVYTFKLKKGVKFHDGEAFDCQRRQVQLRARQGDEESTNKAKKAVFDNISSDQRARSAHGDPRRSTTPTATSCSAWARTPR